MKKLAILINAGRGQTMIEEDLYAALIEGEIAAAGLDVFEKEPIRADHPLMKLDNVVCLPHIGSASVKTREEMIEQSEEHTSELQSRGHLVCRLLLEKKKTKKRST